MIEPSIELKNLLWNNWVIASPAKDFTNIETFVPNQVHFTTRYWATNPERIHNYQISCLPGTGKKIPEEVGALVTYKVEEEVKIHVWATAGIGDDYETVEANLRNMLDHIDLIIRVRATTAGGGLQFVRVSPGWDRPQDDPVHRRVFHRVASVTAIFYRTETGLVPAPSLILQADIGKADLNVAG